MTQTISGVGISVGGVTGDLSSLDAALRRQVQAGCEVAELQAAALHVTVGGRNNAARLAEVARICAQHALGYSVHAPIAINFMDEAHSETHRAVMLCSIELAAALGATVMVIHPGRVPPAPDRSDRTRLLAVERDAIRHAADAAGRHGIRIAMENLNPDRTMMAGIVTSYALDPRALTEQIAAIGHEAVCGTLDFGHGWLASAHLGFDYVAALRDFAPSVGHLHVTDNTGTPMTIHNAAEAEYIAYGMGDLHLPIGWGTVSYDELLADLPVRAGTRMIAEVKGVYGDTLAANVAAMRGFQATLNAAARVAVGA
jgi:sugar phosphate isomerase/epimerase